MRVDLLEFEQETVVPILRLNHDEFRIWDARRDLALLREHEKPVCLDADDERTRGELREHMFRRATPPRDIVRVELAGDVDVAIGVETRNELVSLVAEVRLCREEGSAG